MPVTQNVSNFPPVSNFPQNLQKARIVKAVRTTPFRTPPLNKKHKPAGILVPIITRCTGGEKFYSVLLTQRAKTLRTHAGQIAFPGGSLEAKDSDITQAALRETHEEVGIEPKKVEVAGYLDPYKTGTGFCIFPVVGFITSPLRTTANPAEVDKIFEVPLDFLTCPQNYRRQATMIQQRWRRYYSIVYEHHKIWGATAGILYNLTKKLQTL